MSVGTELTVVQEGIPSGRRNSPPGEGDGVYDRFVPVDAPDPRLEVRHIRGNGTVESEDNLRAREQGGQLTLLADAEGARKSRRT